MIKYLCDNYKQKYNKMLIGTTENNIPFYVKQGFDKYEKTIKNFFVDNYDEKILDNLDFYPISEFTQVKKQELMDNYQDYTYGIMEGKNTLIVGNMDFVEKNLQDKTSKQVLNLKTIDELIHKINRQATKLKQSLV